MAHSLHLKRCKNSRELCVTGQITGLNIRNRWHESDVMKNIIKVNGFVPHLSGRQDVRTAILAPGAVFSRDLDGSNHEWSYEFLGNLPPTGTLVERLQQKQLDELVENQRENLFYFGRAYGDDNIQLPIYMKHFGDPKRGGQGEAYHTLIAGKTGSGKSTFAKMALTCYAKHKDMAVLIVDPKGEFADEINDYQLELRGFHSMQF